MIKKLLIIPLFSALLSICACDSDLEEYNVQIKDHKFIPEELSINAGKKVKIVIENLDQTSEEFESHDLNREKIIAGGKKASIIIGPLEVGRYKYFGEFNPDTAQGVIVVK